MSYSDLFQIVHERDWHEDIVAGDLVRTGPNLFPHYTVVAVSGETAWVKNVETGAQALTAINRCRRIEEQLMVRAA
jgi:hypothetical protein